MGTFTIHWDCPECCGSDSSSSSSGSSSSDSSSSSSSSSGGGGSEPCDYCISIVQIHRVRAADPSIGVEALDDYVVGYVPSCNFDAGDSVYNDSSWDCTCTIDAVMQDLCFSTYQAYLDYWASLDNSNKWWMA